MFISITPYKIYAFSVLELNLCIFFLMIGSNSSRWLYDFLTVFFKEWRFFKILLWNNCLKDIFSLFIDLHFTGKRKFEELKKQDIKLDFSSNEDFYSQIKNRISDDFDFKEYSERQKLINKILNPNNESKEELDNIYKNVLIRNVIQHRNNIVDSYILKRLGSSQIKILDMAGNLKFYKENDKILLSIPEIHSFKSSMFIIGQIWRVKDE